MTGQASIHLVLVTTLSRVIRVDITVIDINWAFLSDRCHHFHAHFIYHANKPYKEATIAIPISGLRKVTALEECHRLDSVPSKYVCRITPLEWNCTWKKKDV
jgi:hypothetical protein